MNFRMCQVTPQKWFHCPQFENHYVRRRGKKMKSLNVTVVRWRRVVYNALYFDISSLWNSLWRSPCLPKDIQVQMAQASASRLALTVQLEMYIDEFFNSSFFTNCSSSSLLLTLKDLTSLLPNLPVKKLSVGHSNSQRRNFIEDLGARGKAGESLFWL